MKTIIGVRPEYAAELNVTEHAGYLGWFTTDQSPLAEFPNGTRIVKIKAEKGDSHPIGATGVVLGSLGQSDIGVAYFIEWDASPKRAVLTIGWKVRADA